MDDSEKQLLEKLRAVRVREDIVIPPSPYFRETFVDRRGNEKPLTLRHYQAQMVAHLLYLKRFVVGDDTGLGKTIETIAALCQIWRKHPDQKVIVVTKKSSVSPGWEIEGFGAFTRDVNVWVCAGTPKKRKAIREEWLNGSGPCVLLYTYGSFANDFSDIQHWRDYIIIYDEATAFKSPDTRIHKIARHMSQNASRCWGLTATLLKNDLLEGYGVYKVVEPNLFPMNKGAFINNYCIVEMKRVGRGKFVQNIVGYRPADIDRFKDEIDLYYLGRAKHAVAKDLPLLTTRDVEVPLYDWQEEKYAEALSGLLELGDGDQKETTDLTALIYCQQIVNHPALIGFPDYPSAKLDVLTDMLTDGDLEDENVIIFTRFAQMVDVAMNHLTQLGQKCVRVTGAESSEQRKAAMNAFQDPKNPVNRIFITLAGGDAINLQSAKAIIFFDTPWSAGDYIQILGRMIRIGSEHDSVYAFHLVAKNTIDAKVQQVKDKKMALINRVLGERVKGEKGNDVVYDAGNGVKDVFDALRTDARKLLK